MREENKKKKIITKIKEKHNKFIQKLDTPTHIDLIVRLFPIISLCVPGLVAYTCMYSFNNISKIGLEVGLAYIFIGGVCSALAFHENNIEKHIKKESKKPIPSIILCQFYGVLITYVILFDYLFRK